MSKNEEQRNLQGELDEMENCEELKRQMDAASMLSGLDDLLEESKGCVCVFC